MPYPKQPLEAKELELLPHKFQVMFALFCAKQVEDQLTKYPECRVAIEVVERWLDGKASLEECHAAANATYAIFAAYTTYAAANDAAAYITYVAACATYTSINSVACATATPSMIQAQWEYYHKLLNFDQIVEENLLGRNEDYE